MKTVSEIARGYGIPVSTINSAVEADLLDVEVINGKRGINEESEKFRSWYEARLQQSRVKGDVAFIEALATYAAQHRICIRRQRVPDRYSILEPLSMLFNILEACPEELDFAQAASIGEIDRVVGCGYNVAAEYVSLFYTSIGGNQADQYGVNRLLSKQAQIKSAYMTFYRANMELGGKQNGLAAHESAGSEHYS